MQDLRQYSRRLGFGSGQANRAMALANRLHPDAEPNTPLLRAQCQTLTTEAEQAFARDAALVVKAYRAGHYTVARAQAMLDMVAKVHQGK